MQPTLKPRIISVHRRTTIHRDGRTAIQIDARIHARKSLLGRRVSDRPTVLRSGAQIDVRIVNHEKTFRTKHRPEMSGG